MSWLSLPPRGDIGSPERNLPPDRDRQLQGLLIALVAINLVPHALDAPPWIVAISAGFLLWKSLHLYRGFAKPSRFFGNAMAALASVGVLFQYHTIFGQEAASALLLLLASLKVLDTSGYRDAMLVILTSYFLLMTHLLASQSLPSTAFMAVDVFLITTLMFQAHKLDRRGSARSFRPIMRILAYATPLWFFLFFAFPRFGASLMPSAARGGANAGFSDSLEPGQISRLVESEEPAFRARFDKPLGSRRATKKIGIEDMYWRAAILAESRGLSWARGASERLRAPKSTDANGPIGYEVILEPGFRRHLFTLESARAVEFDDRSLQDSLRVGLGEVFSLEQAAEGRIFYRGSADVGPRAATEKPEELRRWLQVPADVGQGAIDLARRLGDGAQTDGERSERVQRYFAEGGFRYTKSPGSLRTGGLDEFLFESKRGFCEHFAGAYATLMRLMGVPARVVVGFFGGKLNEFNSYILVRGLDAHAWVEIYRRDLGGASATGAATGPIAAAGAEGAGGAWQRVDPTIVVAPLRSVLGGDFNLADPSWLQAGLSSDEMQKRRGWLPRLAWRAEMAWDATTTAWTSFLLRYDFAYQAQLLAGLGLGGANRLIFMIWLIIGAFGIGAAIYAFLRWQSKREDPLVKAWRIFCARLERAGVARPPAEGPVAFAERLRQARSLPGAAAARAEALAREFAELRYGLAPDPARRAKFLREARAFRAS